MSGEFPGFPTLAKVPLTARATVTEATSSGRSAPAQVQVASSSSNLEHRNKGDPFLTRLLYGMLAWFNNVPLEKGYSQVDWLKKVRATPAPRLRRDITMAEVKQHRTRDDAWMVFRNRVYDITPYLRFHPGGVDILMKAAGRDGTSLFMKYHPWVNIDALMEKCLVGLLVESEVPTAAAGAAAAAQQQVQKQPGAAEGAARQGGGEAAVEGGVQGVVTQVPVVPPAAPPPVEQGVQVAGLVQVAVSTATPSIQSLPAVGSGAGDGVAEQAAVPSPTLTTELRTLDTQ